jgi:hypothetical protein
MKNLIITLIFVFSYTNLAHAHKCACGSYSSGTTIEYDIVDSANPDCCNDRVVRNAYQFYWLSNGDETYSYNGYDRYLNASQAQTDCCTPPAS